MISTWTVDVDQEVSIYSNFESSYTAPPSFICGDGTEIDFIHVNNNTVDCEDGADEQWYDSNTPDDNSDDCQKSNDEDCEGEPVNWFDCHDDYFVWIFMEKCHFCQASRVFKNTGNVDFHGDMMILYGF